MSLMLETARRYFADLLETLPEPPLFHKDVGNTHWGRVSEGRRQARALMQNLEDAQVFQLDESAGHLLSELCYELGDGIGEMFAGTPLPFDRIWIELTPIEGQTRAALITQEEGGEQVSFMTLQGGRFSPPMQVTRFSGTKGSHIPSAFYAQGVASNPARKADWDGYLQEHMQMAYLMIGLAKAMSVTLQNKGMLEADTLNASSSLSRQERRRAERRGEVLPAKRITRIKLGEFGRAQMEAMAESTRPAGARKRAHWVRGHFMRNRSGGTSWRMPHVRGAGPLIKQERQVTASDDTMEP